MDPSDDEAATAAAKALRDVFASDSPRIIAVFDALLRLLTGGGSCFAKVSRLTMRASLIQRVDLREIEHALGTPR